MDDDQPLTNAQAWRWFGRGAARVASLPAFILIAAFVGFGGLARESGATIGQAMFMTATIWALPSMIVVVGAIKAGTPLLAMAIAVALSAFRLMPMAMALTPVVRSRHTKRRTLLVLSHFVAVTAWVFGMTRLPDLPRHARVAYFFGFAGTLTTINIGVTALAFMAASVLPWALAAGLALLTPLYFTLSLWGAARLGSDRLALVFGVLLAPVFHALDPERSLIWIGLTGGLAAYGVSKLVPRLARPDGAAPEGEGP